MTNGPVLIDLDQNDTPNNAGKTTGEKQVYTPASAPPVPDIDDAGEMPTGRAMQTAAAFVSRKPSRMARWFWALVTTLLGAVISLAAWDFVIDLIARSPILGYGIAGILAAILAIVAVQCARELAAFARLRRMDKLHRAAIDAHASDDLVAARDVVARLDVLYRGRADTAWARARMGERMADQFDAAGLLALAETELMAPLDKLAVNEAETAARQVATVTALVPLALADVAAALFANIRMIRRIAEIYGGRSGTLGSWRLVRAVLAHLVATGAVAVGDDMLGSVAGGTLLGKLSRRFGEGLVNGALTARVGVAAIEVCRPLPFVAQKRPSVSALVARALKGLFGSKSNG